VIYLDSSVVIARLLAESRQLPDESWHLELVSSALLQYEVWNRLNARGVNSDREQHARNLLGRVQFIDLAPRVLERALRPFPVEVRTLDGLHLATVEYLRGEGASIELATFDARMIAAARALGIAIYAP
jgi:predicted nucleic acid-binding protein